MGKIASKLKSKDLEFVKLYLSEFPARVLIADADQYYNTLMDFDFIFLKIQHPDLSIESLIMDYTLIDDLNNSNRLKPRRNHKSGISQTCASVIKPYFEAGQKPISSAIMGNITVFPSATN
jgi:hypothetical protein